MKKTCVKFQFSLNWCILCGKYKYTIPVIGRMVVDEDDKKKDKEKDVSKRVQRMVCPECLSGITKECIGRSAYKKIKGSRCKKGPNLEKNIIIR